MLGLSLTLVSGSALASGFQLFEYSGAAMGNNNAGGAAEADDATTATTNPAGLVRLQQPTMSLSAIGVWSQADFQGQACGGSGTLCHLTPAHQNGGGYTTVPAFQIAVPINDVLYAGLSLTAPFGLTTNYQNPSNVAYAATLSQIQTVDLSPSLGVKVTPKLSVGLGLDAQRLNAKLNQAVNVAPPLGIPDAQARNKASDWAYGWNAGVLYQFTQATRFGLDFHSHVVHKPTGSSTLSGNSYGLVKADNLSTTLDLPAYTTFSGFHQFNSQWSLMGTAVYTDWKQIQSIVVGPTVQPRVATGVPPQVALAIAASQTQLGTVALPENFASTWRFSLGTDYQMTDHWRFRVGAGYDASPVNDKDRSVRLPDSDRYALSGGVQYKFNQAASIDAGYTHLFFDDAKIDQQQATYKTIGHSDNAANLLGVQLNLTMI